MIDLVTSILRHFLRVLRKDLAFVLLAGLMLALGIASTTAVFSMINGVLLTPPPYEDPDRLVFVQTARADDRDEAGLFDWPEPLWTEWLAETESFASIAGYRWGFNFLVSDDGSEPLEGMMVSEDYFSVVGLEPHLGRTFVDSDSDGTENPAVIIGHDLWLRRFDSDPMIVGKTIRLTAEVPLTVVGVMPPKVRFLPSPRVAQEPNYDMHATVDYWVPIPRDLRERPAWNVVARLKPGVTTTEAEAEVDVLLAAQTEAVPALEGVGAQLDSLPSVLNADGRRLLLPLLAAGALVLLVACGNAAALLLIRGVRRQHEYGLRAAIGAGRARMFGLVIADSLLLATLGGAAGVALALGIVRLFKLVGGNAIPRLEDVSIGWPVLAFALGAALLACCLAGLAPAIRAAALSPVEALKLGGSKSSIGHNQRRLLAGVVVGQTALTLALLVGAGLLIRTIYNLDRVQSGYETRNVLTMSVTALEEDWQGFHELALERVSALPGVEGSAFAWGVPLTGNAWSGRVEIEGYFPPDRTDPTVSVPRRAVTSGYFDLLDQPVTVGRDFRASDDRDAPPVAIVNEAFVDRYLRGAYAIGKQLWAEGRNGPPTTIVGVLRNGRTNDLAQRAEPEVYLPLWQSQAFSKHLVVRSRGAPEAIASAVGSALRDISPTVAIANVKTLDEIRGESLAARGFAMQLLIGFAVVACLLTLGGVYSVLSLSVAARRREIAIRSAVGAERNRIVGLVLSQGMKMIVAGAVIGVLASFALSSLLQAMLYEVEVTDLVTVVGATTLFVLVALLACWLPGRRAASIDPMEALKAE